MAFINRVSHAKPTPPDLRPAHPGQMSSGMADMLTHVHNPNQVHVVRITNGFLIVSRPVTQQGEYGLAVCIYAKDTQDLAEQITKHMTLNKINS
jgi:hypothetical protein